MSNRKEFSLVYYSDGDYPERDVETFLKTKDTKLISKNSMVVVIEANDSFRRVVSQVNNWCISREKTIEIEQPVNDKLSPT